MDNLSAQASVRAHHKLDISSWEFWQQSFAQRDETFALLRDEAGPTWHRPVYSPYPNDEPGIWAVTRAEDIVAISRDHETFSSAHGPGIDNIPEQSVVDATNFFFAMDPPKHTLYRRLVSAAFTPRNVAKLQEKIDGAARDIVAELNGSGEVDFVAACAGRLPMRTISDLVGVAPEDRPAVARAAEEILAGHVESGHATDDPREFTLSRIDYLRAAAIDVANDRRAHPRDDLMSAIVHAEVDGHMLNDDQIGAFMMLVTLAGLDTTKQTTSHGVVCLDRHPEQRAWLIEDYEERTGTAIEEMVRFASPILVMTRKATRDTQVRGASVRAGDRLALFYCSGNRDERVFDEPDALNLARTPNSHIGFGGGGIHYCLGSQVAKSQLRAIFRELLFHAPGFALLDDPEMQPNHQAHAVKHLRVRF